MAECCNASRALPTEFFLLPLPVVVFLLVCRKRYRLLSVAPLFLRFNEMEMELINCVRLGSLAVFG